MFFIIAVKRKIGAPELTLWIVMILSISLPHYSPDNDKVLCSRAGSYLVRRFLRTKWYPILDRYGAKLPLECPLHPQREIFWKQEAGKSHHKTNHWTCSFCGKSFQTEKHIDQHMERRHDDCLYLSEDAVCLADYCDIFRCDVLETIRQRDVGSSKQEPTTDLEIWKDKTALKNALQKSPSRDLTLYKRKPKKEGANVLSSCNQLKQQQYNIFILAREKYQSKEDCFQPPSECVDCNNKNATNSTADLPLEDDVWTAYRKQKAQCNDDEMGKIRQKCEDLVHVCTIGLLAAMSATDFKDLYAELRQSLCEFLSCSRYWEDVIGGDRKFPWIAAGLLVILLSFGVCIAYYIVWGVTEDEIPSRVVPVIKTEEVKEIVVSERNGRSHSQGRSRRYGRPEDEERRDREREGSSTLPRRSRHHRDEVVRDHYRDEDGFRVDEQKRRAASDRFSSPNSSFQESSPCSDIYEESLWPVVEEGSDVEEVRSDCQR